MQDELSASIDFVFITYIHRCGSLIKGSERVEECSMSVRKLEQVAPFYFCVDVGQYTGVSAASYEDFLASIKRVDVKSLSFHVDRGDFENWVLDVLKDERLAREIGKLRNRKLRGQALRNRLYRIVSERCKELTK